MNDLQTYKFHKLYDFSSGISSKPEQAGHGSPFVSFSTVFNNYFVPNELNELMDSSLEEQEKYSILKGDILLTRTSETVDELAMSCVAIKDYPNVTYSGFLKRLRPLQNDITYDKYMAFYLRSKLFRKTMTNNAVLTLRASLNEQIFSYLDLVLPKYEEQVKIGNLLYSINQQIELNHKINQELEVTAKILYDYWFVQFDFPNADDKPYKNSGGKMVYSEELKREIPEGWSYGSFEDLALITGGSTPSKAILDNFSVDGIPWITPKDLALNKGNKFITKGATDITEKGLKSSSLKKLVKGSILLSTRAPIGYMAIARNELTTNQGFKSFIPKNNYSTEYIFYTIKSVMKLIEKNASGSTFKEISSSVLKTLKISLAPIELIDTYTNIVKSTFERQDLLEQENQKLTELRDWLLPMLMNGQVKVADATEMVDELMVAEPSVEYGES